MFRKFIPVCLLIATAHAVPVLAQNVTVPVADANADMMQSCKVLKAEAEQIAGKQSKHVHNAEAGRKLAGFASNLLAAAAPQLMEKAGSDTKGIVAQSMIATAQQSIQAAAQAATKTPDQPETDAQRMERLKAMLGERGC